MIVCRIFGHRWETFTAEQCPEIYRLCERCDQIEHVCNAAQVDTPPTIFDPSRENICGALSWIANQATDGMHIAAGSATTHGDASGALETLSRILSDIAINAEIALDAEKS